MKSGKLPLQSPDDLEKNTPLKPLFSITKIRIQIIVVGFALVVILLTGVKFPKIVERINNSVTDLQISFLPKKNISKTPVIVEVDEKSLAAYGQWPWPRYQVAHLLEVIKNSGASAVGVDAIFAEPDRTSPAEIKRAMERDFKKTFPLEAIDKSLRDYDSILGDTLKSGPFVVSYFFTFHNSNSNACSPKSASGALLTNEEENSFHSLHQAVKIICNVPLVQEGANFSGFINTSPDSDGIFRKTPLVIEYAGRLYPSLALQTYLTANSLESFILSDKKSGFLLSAGKLEIPLDKGGNLLINFPKNDQPFDKVSASDLLNGKLSPKAFKGKIVFIGFSAAGLHEYRPTPHSPQFLGVEFHAAIVDNLERNDFLFRPKNAQLLELIFATLLGIGLFAGLVYADLFASEIIPFMVIFSLFILTQFCIATTGTVISPALPVLVSFFVFLTLALIKYANEYLRAKRMAVIVARTQDGIIGSFCSMSEYRDPETGAHIRRTQEYMKALAMYLKDHPKFKADLTPDNIELLYKAAPLHDIGKIGIRDHILLKNGRLTDNEFEVMQSHPQIGADIIESVALQIGWNPFMRIAHQICLSHQEKWDGSGYPKGLSGDAIPYPARFMALADVYDALISKRVYKPAFSHTIAVALIREGKNYHFDPIIIEAFESIHEKFRDIALNFLDDEEQRETLLAEHKK